MMEARALGVLVTLGAALAAPLASAFEPAPALPSAPAPPAYAPRAYAPPWLIPVRLPEPVAKARRNRGLMIAGIVVSSAAALLLASAGAFTAMHTGDACVKGPCGSQADPIIFGLLVGSLGTAAVGLPMAIYGSGLVPAAKDHAALGPMITGGPRGTGWTWRF